jgi:hypothetical protein
MALPSSACHELLEVQLQLTNVQFQSELWRQRICYPHIHQNFSVCIARRLT